MPGTYTHIAIANEPGVDARRWETPAPGACEFTLAGRCAPAPP